MADVDEFKKYNDAFGHPAGDEVLKKVAKILLARPGRWTARPATGVRSLPFCSPKQWERRPAGGGADSGIGWREEEFPGRKITISIGMAEFPEHGPTAEAVISRADEALYAAKRGGRNRIVRAGPEGQGQGEG